MAIKVAFIGAGSVGFTRKLVQDVLAVPELQDTHFAFTDINKRNLDMITQLCRKDIKSNKLPARLTSTTDRRRAVADADYVEGRGLKLYPGGHGRVTFRFAWESGMTYYVKVFTTRGSSFEVMAVAP